MPDKSLEELNKGRSVLPIMSKIAKKHHVPFMLNDTYSGKCALIGDNHHRFIIFDEPFNINYSGSVKVCMNKDICSSFLKRNGFSVPSGTFYTRRSTEKNIDLLEPMLNYIKTLNHYPLIVKPATLSQGVGIVKINSYEEAKEKLLISLNCDKKVKTFLIQKFYKGNDYRVVVLDGEVIQCYKRVPFYIKGDGVTNIETLLENKISKFIEDERDKKVDINDKRIYDSIESKGYKKEDILEKDVTLNLQDIANLSLGGEAIDYTDTISDYYKDIAIRASKCLNLRLSGIDFICDDISNDKQRDYVILEINSAPGLDNYLYKDKQVQEQYVEELYEKIFLYLLKENKINYKTNIRK